MNKSEYDAKPFRPEGSSVGTRFAGTLLAIDLNPLGDAASSQGGFCITGGTVDNPDTNWQWELQSAIINAPKDIASDRLEMVIEQAKIIRKLGREEGTPEDLYNLALMVSWNFDLLKSMEYSEFLATEYWKTIRNYKIFRSGYKCGSCSDHANLRVHHLTYQFRGREIYHLETLQVLCKSCHEELHDITARED